ncbi:MAG: hypothetical protein ACHQAX_09675 [Gammaproteobacteria bacterium]
MKNNFKGIMILLIDIVLAPIGFVIGMLQGIIAGWPFFLLFGIGWCIAAAIF